MRRKVGVLLEKEEELGKCCKLRESVSWIETEETPFGTESPLFWCFKQIRNRGGRRRRLRSSEVNGERERAYKRQTGVE